APRERSEVGNGSGPGDRQGRPPVLGKLKEASDSGAREPPASRLTAEEDGRRQGDPGAPGGAREAGSGHCRLGHDYRQRERGSRTVDRTERTDDRASRFGTVDARAPAVGAPRAPESVADER